MTIHTLKWAARKAYREFAAETEGMDCGQQLAKEINPRAAEAAREFNAAMTELLRIDPAAPKNWRPL